MRTKIGFISLIMLAAFCGFEIYHQTGIVHMTRKNGPGCICHDFNPSTTVRVWVSGPDSLRAGTEAMYRVHVARTGNIAAGFNVATLTGALGIADTAGTYLDRESSTDSLELTHTNSRFANGRDTISWPFYYRAPSSGRFDTIYSVGNAVNNDTLPNSADAWDFGPNFVVRITGTNSVTEEAIARQYRLLQNYPNPFNPATTITFAIPQGTGVLHTATLRVFDVVGREVAVLVNGVKTGGEHSVVFDAGVLASGVYLYRFEAASLSNQNRFTAVKKMLLVR